MSCRFTAYKFRTVLEQRGFPTPFQRRREDFILCLRFIPQILQRIISRCHLGRRSISGIAVVAHGLPVIVFERYENENKIAKKNCSVPATQPKILATAYTIILDATVGS
jgi:hypothetical protein